MESSREETAPKPARAAKLPLRRAILKGGLPDSFTRSLYRVSPYRGCAHGCRYCDGRAEKYYVEGDFEKDIIVRKGVPELFEEELPRLRESGMIAFGSGTTDPYQPCEEAERITGRCAASLAGLQTQAGSRLSLPALVMTKSAMVLRDLPLWSKVQEKAGFLLLLSLTSLDEELRELMEPGASSFAERLALVRRFKEAGCYVGILAMPLLPGLSDSETSIRTLYTECSGVGADFIMPGGLTLRPGRQKELYLATLGASRPELLPRVRALYAAERPSGSPTLSSQRELHARVAPIRREFAMPWLLPHAIHARLLPPWDSFRILLRDMAELYEERGIETSQLREAADRYDAWLLGLRSSFRRARSRPPEWFPERFEEAVTSEELGTILGNTKLASFAEEVLRDGARLDYVTLRLEQAKP
jgi:DNA repair photolyase